MSIRISFQHPRRTREWIAAAALLLMAALLFITAIRFTHMREDEEIAFRTTAYDLTYAVWYQAEQDIQAPLWFILFWGWQQLAGSTEFSARIFSLMFALVTLALLYRLARRWFASEWAGLFSVGAAVLNTYAFIHLQEIRPYPLVGLSAVLSMWAFKRWIDAPRWGRALLYGASVALMLYVHYFLGFLVIVQALYVLVVARRSRLIVQGLGAGAFGFVLWLPWLPAFLNQLRVLRELSLSAGDARGLGIGTPSTTVATNWDSATTFINLASNGQPLLYLIVLLAGVWLVRQRKAYLLALGWGVGVPLVAMLLNLLVAVYEPRYVSYASLGLALSMGASLAAVLGRWRFPAAAGAAALLILSFGPTLPQRIPFRDIYGAMSRLAEPGDVVLNSRVIVDNFVAWHQRAYLSEPLQAGTVSELDSANQHRRVWFVTGDWFHEEVQAQFRALERTHPVQTVLGDCTRAWCFIAQLMEGPPQTEAQVFGGQLGFLGADVEAVSSEAVHTRLWWRADAAIPLDYSLGLHLLNADGRLVAQTDGPISHYGVETVQTSQMEPGRLYIDHRALILPGDLAPGEYRLAVIVYQSWDGERLTLASGVDAVDAGEVTIPP